MITNTLLFVTRHAIQSARNKPIQNIKSQANFRAVQMGRHYASSNSNARPLFVLPISAWEAWVVSRKTSNPDSLRRRGKSSQSTSYCTMVDCMHRTRNEPSSRDGTLKQRDCQPLGRRQAALEQL